MFFLNIDKNDREASFLHRSILSTSSLQNCKICYLITKACYFIQYLIKRDLENFAYFCLYLLLKEVLL